MSAGSRRRRPALEMQADRAMWSIEDIEASPIELDFSSSGGGRRAATAVSAAGVRLFNAIELVDANASAPG